MEEKTPKKYIGHEGKKRVETDFAFSPELKEIINNEEITIIEKICQIHRLDPTKSPYNIALNLDICKVTPSGKLYYDQTSVRNVFKLLEILTQEANIGKEIREEREEIAREKRKEAWRKYKEKKEMEK